jgi:hypothetical protein
MTDDEYRAYLSALARRHLRGLPYAEAREVEATSERLAATARLNREIRERILGNLDTPRDLRPGAPREAVTQSTSPPHDVLVNQLAGELERSSKDVAEILAVMERCGVLDALDEAPRTTFGEMRASAVPREDLDMLRRCGVDDPEAEIEIVTQYCRTEVYPFWSRPRHAALPSTQLERAPDTLMRAARLLRSAPEPSPPAGVVAPPKKRKIFNGIGKILSGAVAGAGNVLLVGGTIVAPNPATGYGAIASSAIAAGSIFQGIGDLRGE